MYGGWVLSDHGLLRCNIKLRISGGNGLRLPDKFTGKTTGSLNNRLDRKLVTRITILKTC